jgi:hypothetical protein
MRPGVRVALAGLAVACLAAPMAHAHLLDHAAPPFGSPTAPPQIASSGGPGAKWEFLATIPTGNPHTDLDFFTRGGETYASVGTLGVGPNGGGQTIVQLTQAGRVAPKLAANFPSASCISNPAAATGLQHDVEAAPKGNAILNTDVLRADRRDTQVILDATDAEGRCHDQGLGGLANAPQGGLEIVDVTDPTKPAAIGLTSHIGEAHTVNVDPKRPHIAYAVTSDGVTVDAQGKRANETSGFALDGFEVVDLSSCLNFPAGTSLEAKRAACRPQVFRYRYPTTDIGLGHTNKGTLYACHELEVYPDDRLMCASGQAMIALDMKDAFDDRGTPNDFSDDKPRGTPLPCQVRDSSSTGPFTTGAKVTDCVDGTGAGTDDLLVSKWLTSGAPSLAGVRWLGSAFHAGRESTTGAAQPKFDSTQDVDFDHEAELTASGRYVLATDERGGGIAPPGASCSPSVDNKTGNGGIHVYRTDRLLNRRPANPDDAFSSYARTGRNAKAIFRVEIRTKPQAALCTAHVFQQIPGQNRIFMGWYSQGTRVIDFTENADGTVDLKEAGFFIPVNADDWVSHVFKVERNNDGSFTYYGASGDFAVGDGGRNAIDVWKVTLPAPPAPRGGPLPGAGRGFAPVPKRCVARRARMTSRGIGAIRLSQRRATVLRRAGRPEKAAGRIWTYCVTGAGRRGKVKVVFAPGRNGAARLVGTTWRLHRARRVAPGSRLSALRRSFPRRRGLGRGLALANRRSGVVIGTRAGRVRYLAAITRRLALRRTLLRAELRRAALR